MLNKMAFLTHYIFGNRYCFENKYSSGNRSIFDNKKIPRHIILKDPAPATYSAWFWWTLMAAVLCGLFIMTISLAEASPSSDESMHSGDGDSGRIEFRDANGALSDGLLVQTEVNMTITGMVATVTYQQDFHNNSQNWVEGRYVFPLPETAAVNAMTLRIGERLIVGEIKEKQEAQKIYQQAKQSGKRASLVEQQRPNMFTQKIANIGPNERIQITLTYRQTVDYEHERFSLRLPLTITPRYIPGAPLVNQVENGEETGVQTTATTLTLNDAGWGWALPTDQVPDAHQITPFMTPDQHLSDGSVRNPVSIHIDLNAGLPLARIDSPYHDIVIQKQDKQHTISLSKGSVPMDRDFVLTWQPVSEQAPRAALFTEHIKNNDYLLLMLLPPQLSTQTPGTSLPREVTFIVDTSGSMGGTSIEQAKASLQLALSTLTSRDRFNIVEFNSGFQRYSDHSQLATAENLRRAQAFVAGLRATGGTEMYAPLNAVLSDPAEEGFLKQVIFITDGSVGNESALFQLIESKLGSARLFMVGIGSAPNSFFMRKSAQFGRGTFTHVGNLAEVSDKMSALFQQLQTPVLRDIQVTWPDGMSAEVYPAKHPDLYSGQPLLLKVKALKAKGADGQVTVTGHSTSGHWSQTLQLQPTQDSSDNNPKNRPEKNGIASLWAREKIAALMDQKHTGTPESDIKPQVIDVALTHQLMSAYTSFVAVDQTPARPAEADLTPQSAPNLVAKGQKAMPQTIQRNMNQKAMQRTMSQKTLNAQSMNSQSMDTQTAYSYPQTALGLSWQLLLGSLCAALALVFIGISWTQNALHRSSRVQISGMQA